MLLEAGVDAQREGEHRLLHLLVQLPEIEPLEVDDGGRTVRVFLGGRDSAA